MEERTGKCPLHNGASEYQPRQHQQIFPAECSTPASVDAGSACRVEEDAIFGAQVVLNIVAGHELLKSPDIPAPVGFVRARDCCDCNHSSEARKGDIWSPNLKDQRKPRALDARGAHAPAPRSMQASRTLGASHTSV